MIEIQVDAPSHIEVDLRGLDFNDLTQLLEAGARAALAARGVERAELSVALVDDAAIQALNRDHLGHDHPTDVMAFGLWSPGDPVVVGDVYVGLDQAERQAAELGVSLGDELVRLTIHGTLHVTGMDHPEGGAERAGSEMYRLQERLVAEVMAGG